MSGAYVYAAVRTPFGKLGGGLAQIRPDDLAATVLTGLLAKTPRLAPGAIDEVVWGNANGAGEENRNVGRMAVLLAGLPTSVPATTVNRLCGSSLDAAMIASRTIETGDADIRDDQMARIPADLVDTQLRGWLDQGRQGHGHDLSACGTCAGRLGAGSAGACAPHRIRRHISPTPIVTHGPDFGP
jgi:Acetyl-CoA acetyltransferase